MNRRTFITHGCACGTLILSGAARGPAASTESSPAKPDQPLPVNPGQVMAVLTDIDGSGDMVLIDAVFTRWGYQCFHNRHELKAFAERQRADFPGYVDYVNSGRSRAWEQLDYDANGGIIRVTGRKTGKCVCAYAQCPRPAKALCTHCCTAFQAELFRTMTGRTAVVQIDESVLLGGERCRTTVRLAKSQAPVRLRPPGSLGP
jgi:hypothetical protein